MRPLESPGRFKTRKGNDQICILKYLPDYLVKTTLEESRCRCGEKQPVGLVTGDRDVGFNLFVSTLNLFGRFAELFRILFFLSVKSE